MEKKPYYLIQSVVRTLNIFEYLSINGESSVTEIADYLGENKTTAHRFLLSIKHEGYIEQNQKNKKYKLSIKVFEIGNRVMDALDIRTVAKSVIKDLSYKLSETINLGILNRGDIVYIDKAISYNNLRLDSPIGGRDPAHSTALGKCILAFLPESVVDNYVFEYGLIMKTKNTITKAELLYKELALIKEQGYAYDKEEIVMGVECVAAPIFDSRMNPIAAISVSIPVNVENSKKLKKYKDYIVIASKEISNKLGAKI